MLLEILCYALPILAVVIWVFYTGKKKKEICKTLQLIKDLVVNYREASKDGKITKEEMEEILDHVVAILDIWGSEATGKREKKIVTGWSPGSKK